MVESQKAQVIEASELLEQMKLEGKADDIQFSDSKFNSSAVCSVYLGQLCLLIMLT